MSYWRQSKTPTTSTGASPSHRLQEVAGWIVEVVSFLGGRPRDVAFAKDTGLEPVWACWGTSPRQSSQTLAASEGAGDHSLTDLKHDFHEEVVPAMPGAEHTVGVLHLASSHELWLL